MPLLQLDALEFVALIRDLLVILLILFFFGVLLLAGILGFLLYRKVAPILDSLKAIANNAKETSTLVTERIVRPLSVGPGLIGNAKQVMDSVERLFHRGGRDENGGDGKERR